MRRLLAVATAAAVVLPAAPAYAHEGDPNFRSDITSVTPAVDGLTVEVLNRDDRLLVTNRTGETVLVEGYRDGEPYARLLGDGTVQVNRDSAATYLNEERDGIVDVPDAADGKGAPRWETVSGSGRFEFHDHRMHWMGDGVPPSVTDESRTQKVNDWAVPIRVGDRPGEIAGELWWTPQDDGGPPVAAIAALIGIALAGLAAVVVVRRRRGRGDAAPGAGETERAEAW